MARSRREFLAQSSMGLIGVVVSGEVESAVAESLEQTPQTQTPATPGAPPAFGTAAPVGPEVTAETFVEAEKLVQVTNSAAHRAEAAGNWRQSMAAVFERRTGPRKVEIEYGDAPATVWNPRLKGEDLAINLVNVTDSQIFPPPLPKRDEDIAFAPLTSLSWWLFDKQISSERLTKIYLERLKRFNQKLNCVITLCQEHALEQARAADKELAAGNHRGWLHGVPWGAKDLLDTAGIKTTWGAEFYRDRVPEKDATVTKRLNDAGAVLVAKLSLGALALNDVWFGGQTMNPWLLEEGSSGSSAGPGAAVAAGLVGFAIGSETQGSIISPSMRCGVTGLRPTFGRVPRTGAMTLSWTCDKLGAMARGVEDPFMVLRMIGGPDKQDVACEDVPLNYLGWGSKNLPVAGMKVGYIESWMKEPPATDVDRHALEVVKQLGMTAVPVTLPNWAYDSLNVILFAESAAAFEKITLDGEVDQLRMQVPDAWPNTFRQSRFLSAVDFVQADRLRRKVALEIERVFKDVDLLLVPSLRDEQLVIFNFTGQPSLTLRAGFVEVSEARSDWAPDPKHPLPKFNPPRRVPHGVTLIGRLFDEGTLCAAGVALEQAFHVAEERPAGF